MTFAHSSSRCMNLCYFDKLLILPGSAESKTCLTYAMHGLTSGGNRVIFEDMKVKTKNGVEGIDAQSIISAKTVLLQLQVEDPDAEKEGFSCA